jgi:hypothetical protein
MISKIATFKPKAERLDYDSVQRADSTVRGIKQSTQLHAALSSTSSSISPQPANTGYELSRNHTASISAYHYNNNNCTTPATNTAYSSYWHQLASSYNQYCNPYYPASIEQPFGPVSTMQHVAAAAASDLFPYNHSAQSSYTDYHSELVASANHHEMHSTYSSYYYYQQQQQLGGVNASLATASTLGHCGEFMGKDAGRSTFSSSSLRPSSSSGSSDLSSWNGAGCGVDNSRVNSMPERGFAKRCREELVSYDDDDDSEDEDEADNDSNEGDDKARVVRCQHGVSGSIQKESLPGFNNSFLN